MPNTSTLEQFIAMVEDNKHDIAIEQFYAEDASMQENQSPPRQGRDVLVATEREMMSKAKTIESECVRPVFVDGENVVIRWRFKFVWKNDTTTEIEELAYQQWKDDKIWRETFFYDPKQFVAK